MEKYTVLLFALFLATISANDAPRVANLSPPADLCLTITCPSNSFCQDGQCIIPMIPCSKACIQGYVCVNG